MRIFRISNIFAWSVAILLGSILFYISQSVQRAENELTRLSRLQGMELEAIRVLEAEWDYLNSPMRLEALAKDYMEQTEGVPPHVTSSVQNVPEPLVPVMPRIKPARFSTPSEGSLQPAVVKVPEKPSARSASNSSRKKQIQNHDRDQFRSLLEGLNDGGAY